MPSISDLGSVDQQLHLCNRFRPLWGKKEKSESVQTSLRSVLLVLPLSVDALLFLFERNTPQLVDATGQTADHGA